MCNRLATVGRIARSVFLFFEYTFPFRSKREQRRDRLQKYQEFNV